MDNNTLFQKIAQVSAAIGPLATDKRNSQQNYEYISADKILERVGGEMAKAGLVVVPAVIREHIEAVPWKQGARYDVCVYMKMTVADVDGNQHEAMWMGRGSDYAVPDKALYKAITSGHKYFLMKLFNIGVGNEDSEHEAPPQNASAPAQNGRKPEPKQAVITEKQRKALHARGVETYGDEWDDKRKVFSERFGKASSKDWTQEEYTRIMDGMQRVLNERNAAQVELFDQPAEMTGAFAE